MGIRIFVEELEKKEIEITFSDGKLKYSGPEENITPELIEKLKENKGKLIKYFWPEELALLMPINTEGDRIPLFIVHGDYANYVISDNLGPDQPVYGFFHPGSEGEPIRFKSVEEMAKTYLDKVLTVSPSGPFYLMGFSFGGTLAYEMAVQLKKNGHQVPFLVLLDSISPLAGEPFRKQSSLYMTIRKNILKPARRKLKLLIKLLTCEVYPLFKKPIPLTKRGDYIYVKYLILTKKYYPEKYDGNIILFRTTENPSSCKYLGWETLVNDIRMFEIKGKHLEIFKDNNNREIIKKEIEKHLLQVNELK